MGNDNVNFREHAKILSIPLFNGFKKVEPDNEQTVFLTNNNHGVMYQVTSDGKMNEKEKINVRIKFVIERTLRYMKEQGFEAGDDTFFYYQDFDSDDFGFKIYIQDIIMPNNKKVIRSFNAFFIEPQYKDFYQVVMSVGPFDYPTETLKVGEMDLDEDPITKNVMVLFEELLKNIKYK
ncbi:MAG: hypothetical protein IJX17_01855 [Clostridia bacterium]|nr:hypothetical protein [Clostridia bacterium]